MLQRSLNRTSHAIRSVSTRALRRSWVPISPTSDFSIHNLPLGIFSRHSDVGRKVVGAALGDIVIDLRALASLGYLDAIGVEKDMFQQDVLNPLMGMGKAGCRRLRSRLQELFDSENQELQVWSAVSDCVAILQSLHRCAIYGALVFWVVYGLLPAGFMGLRPIPQQQKDGGFWNMIAIME